MKLHLEWLRAFTLTDDPKLIYSFDYDRLPKTAGVYVSGRRFGGQFEALYVGKATKLQNRTKRQLNNLKLMRHLQDAKSGERVLLAGRFNAKPGQLEKKCLSILERALIRYFLSEGHDLVNVHGTRLRRHEIASVGSKGNIPNLIFVDRGKGE